jgi:hypothetical protein
MRRTTPLRDATVAVRATMAARRARGLSLETQEAAEAYARAVLLEFLPAKCLTSDTEFDKCVKRR